MKRKPTTKPINGLKDSTSGAALVEMALMLPLLLCLMGGMAEFGRAFQQYHVANKGVKSAARYLARVAEENDCGTTLSANWNTNVTRAKNLARLNSLNGTGSPVLSNWTDADITIDDPTCVANTGGAFNGPAQIPIVNVSTTFTYDDLGMLSLLSVLPLGKRASFAISNIQITASHQELYIGG